MKKCFLLLVLLLLTFTGQTSTAQTKHLSGNLVKVFMFGKTVSPKDTLGKWDYYSDQYGYWSEHYYSHFTLPSHSYLLKISEGSVDRSPLEKYGSHNILIETEGEKSSRKLIMQDFGCVIPPYFTQKAEVVPAACGSWLISGAAGNSFIDKNDSLCLVYNGIGGQSGQKLEENLVFILGKIGALYLASFEKEYNSYEYRLVNLSTSPSISEENSTVVKFSGIPDFYNPQIGRVKKVCNDLYLAQNEHSWGLHFYKFADTSFTYIKSVFARYDNQISFMLDDPWEFRNNKLYFRERTGLCAYDLNLSDTTFSNRRVLLEDYSTDRDFKYAARISSDTLWIYDIEKECYINSISLASLKNPGGIIIDSPFVYLHQLTFEENSSIMAVDENSSAVKSYNLAAYPNPFNPVTTLEFDIPVAGNVELKVYDALGKEVATLMNEVKKEGSYKVQFNASSLPSGIYLCRMSAGKYSMTKKIVLLK